MSGALGASLSCRGPKKTPEGSAGRWDEEVGRPLDFEGATPSSVYDFKEGNSREGLRLQEQEEEALGK